MKERTLDILCCPVCKGDLELKHAKRNADEIIEGVLVCSRCEKEYAIKDGIVDLVP